MRVAILFSLDQLQLMLERGVDLLVIPPACDFDEYDVKPKTSISCVNLNDYLEKGEASSLSRVSANFIRELMRSVDGPIEAISSQNDLYQYHLRGQFLFLVALERFLNAFSESILVFPLKKTRRYYSPMRPEIDLLYKDQRTLIFLASELAKKKSMPVEFASNSTPIGITYVVDTISLIFRRVITNTFIVVKLLQKIFQAVVFRLARNDSYDFSADSFEKKVGIIVRTDSEVISAYSLLESLSSKKINYVIIQDEILSSTTTVSRLQNLNIKYVAIGQMLGFVGLFKSLVIRKKLIRNDRAVDFSNTFTLSEDVVFNDRDVQKELLDRLMDFHLPQYHFSLELRKMIESYHINQLITFAYVDQWGGVVKGVGDQFGIPTLAIQNAAQDPEEYPKLCWADHYCVESLYLKERLISLGYPSDRITGTGLPHYATGAPVAENRKTKKPVMQILILTQPIYDRYYCQLIELIGEFCGNNNYCLAIKYHPRQSGDEYQDVILRISKTCKVEIYKSEPLDEIIQASLLVVSVVSAAILRSLNLGVPTVSFLPKSEKYLDLYYTSPDNLFVASDASELALLLDRIVCDYTGVLRDFDVKLENYNAGHCVFEVGQTPVENVANIISDYMPV